VTFVNSAESNCVLKMNQNSEKIRYILRYHFDQGDNASQACEKIFDVYGEDALSKSAARKWFTRFRSGNFDDKDAPRWSTNH